MYAVHLKRLVEFNLCLGVAEQARVHGDALAGLLHNRDVLQKTDFNVNFMHFTVYVIFNA